MQIYGKFISYQKKCHFFSRKRQKKQFIKNQQDNIMPVISTNEILKERPGTNWVTLQNDTG
jgi:hypothetical protein